MKELNAFRKYLNEGYDQNDFNKLKDALYHGDIPGQLILQKSGEIDILLGFDYPDSLANKVDDIAGVLSANRRVLGIMPHPERMVDGQIGEIGGQALFRALIGQTLTD